MSAELKELRAELDRIRRVIRVLDVAMYVLAGLMVIDLGLVAVIVLTGRWTGLTPTRR